jgi:hypothetical protein
MNTSEQTSPNHPVPEKPVPESKFAIVINGQKKTVKTEVLTYLQVLQLAYEPVDPNKIYTVTYKKGPPSNPEGSMVEGDSVRLDNGMIFNVTPTRKS